MYPGSSLVRPLVYAVPSSSSSSSSSSSWSLASFLWSPGTASFHSSCLCLPFKQSQTGERCIPSKANHVRAGWRAPAGSVCGGSPCRRPCKMPWNRPSPDLPERKPVGGRKLLALSATVHAATQALPPLYTSRSRWTVRPRSSLLKHRALKSRSHLHRGIAHNSSAHLSTPPLMQMDTKQSPNSSLRSGNNQPESEVDINEQYEQYSDGDSAEDNGERPRKRQRRPMSVS